MFTNSTWSQSLFVAIPGCLREPEADDRVRGVVLSRFFAGWTKKSATFVAHVPVLDVLATQVTPWLDIGLDLLGLQWECVDWLNLVIQVPRSKNGQPHAVPLNAMAYAARRSHTPPSRTSAGTTCAIRLHRGS